MNISYVGKKTTVRDSFKDYSAKKLKKLEKFFADDPDVLVVVTNSNEKETVEVTIKSNGMFFRAEKMSEDRMVSLDMVSDVLYRQIVRNKSKLEKRLKVSLPQEDALPESVDAESLVRTKKFRVDVMDAEEAILQMNMIGHEFFMFRNGETGEINVVYRRKDGNYGLLEPIVE